MHENQVVSSLSDNVILSDVANPIDRDENEVKPCRFYRTKVLGKH